MKQKHSMANRLCNSLPTHLLNCLPRYYKGLGLLLALFTVLGAAPVQAQNDCARALQAAQNAYNQGRLQEIEDMLESCTRLGSGATSQDRLQMHRLLTLVSIYLDRPEEAEVHFLAMLNISPDFEADPSRDPLEFQQLARRYRTRPISAVGGIAGVTVTTINASVKHSVSQDSSTVVPGFAPTFRAGVQGYYYLAKRVSVRGEVLYQQRTFSSTERQLGFSSVMASETQTAVSAPVMIHWDLSYTNFRWPPYLILGVAPTYLFNSQLTLTREANFGNGEVRNITGPQTANTLQRRRYNVALVTGVGFRQKLGKNYMYVELRNTSDLFYANLPSQRFNEAALDNIVKFGYVDDDFLLGDLTFSTGFQWNFYKPKKIEKLP